MAPRTPRAIRRSAVFEQRIHRIHELLEGLGVDVTWDDRIPDPDNPDQPRQIDVTIKRGDHLTVIECRIHTRRQGVQWIEELIGRRLSLGAQSVVAVSASGFTKGAIRKAQRHQVAIRDLRRLGDDEVSAWGQSIALSLQCYQYAELTATIWVDAAPVGARESIAKELRTHPLWTSLFNAVGSYLSDNQMLTLERANKSSDFGVAIEPDVKVTLAGVEVKVAELTGRVTPIVIPVDCPRVEAYGPLAEPRDAIVEQFALGETSIVHADSRVAIHLDLSTLQLPPLCQFRAARTNGDGERTIESFSLVGIEQLGAPKGPIAVAVGLLSDRPKGTLERRK